MAKPCKKHVGPVLKPCQIQDKILGIPQPLKQTLFVILIVFFFRNMLTLTCGKLRTHFDAFILCREKLSLISIRLEVQLMEQPGQVGGH